MELFNYVLLVILCGASFGVELCPKQCDCDKNEDGLNRASCVDQHIVGINIGVFKSVQVYVLSRNSISELENYCFKEIEYTSIRVLDLSYNLIFWIGIHAFTGLDKLVQLNISYNRLRFLPPDIFWNTPMLDSLDMSGNLLESLKNEPFLMHSKLQILNLNNCRIKVLPERMFSRLPNLKKLDISENYMISFNTLVLRPLRKLKRLELRNDYWRCDEDFIAIEEWITSHGIIYQKQCKKAHMLEKIISSVVDVKREDVDVSKIWNVINNTNDVQNKTNDSKAIRKYEKDYTAIQTFILGLEVGLAVGVVGTYIWLRKLYRCRLPYSPQARMRRHRIRDSDMRANLLWSSIVNPDLETPPTLRRELSLPDGNVPVALRLPTFLRGSADVIRLSTRAETPPPPYNEMF